MEAHDSHVVRPPYAGRAISAHLAAVERAQLSADMRPRLSLNRMTQERHLVGFHDVVPNLHHQRGLAEPWVTGHHAGLRWP